MLLPKIDDTITTEYAIQLCEHFGYKYLVTRLRENPVNYKNWIFDGASIVIGQALNMHFLLLLLERVRHLWHRL